MGFSISVDWTNYLEGGWENKGRQIVEENCKHKSEENREKRRTPQPPASGGRVRVFSKGHFKPAGKRARNRRSGYRKDRRRSPCRIWSWCELEFQTQGQKRIPQGRFSDRRRNRRGGDPGWPGHGRKSEKALRLRMGN